MWWFYLTEISQTPTLENKQVRGSNQEIDLTGKLVIMQVTFSLQLGRFYE